MGSSLPESLLQPGSRVLLLTGPLQGFDGVIECLDRPADRISVKVAVLGSTISLSFGLSTADQQLAPFGDQPIVLQCPHDQTCMRDLLASCPGADEVYQSSFFASMTLTTAQISRTGSDHRLTIRTHNLTWPARNEMQWATTATPLDPSVWADFSQLVEASGFWRLPYDDGHRVKRDANAICWRMEGYQHEKYHAVVRHTSEPRSDISDCCEYLHGLTRDRPVAAAHETCGRGTRREQEHRE